MVPSMNLDGMYDSDTDEFPATALSNWNIINIKPDPDAKNSNKCDDPFSKQDECILISDSDDDLFAQISSQVLSDSPQPSSPGAKHNDRSCVKPDPDYGYVIPETQHIDPDDQDTQDMGGVYSDKVDGNNEKRDQINAANDEKLDSDNEVADLLNMSSTEWESVLDDWQPNLNAITIDDATDEEESQPIVPMATDTKPVAKAYSEEDIFDASTDDEFSNVIPLQSASKEISSNKPNNQTSTFATKNISSAVTSQQSYAKSTSMYDNTQSNISKTQFGNNSQNSEYTSTPRGRCFDWSNKNRLKLKRKLPQNNVTKFETNSQKNKAMSQGSDSFPQSTPRGRTFNWNHKPLDKNTDTQNESQGSWLSKNSYRPNAKLSLSVKKKKSLASKNVSPRKAGCLNVSVRKFSWTPSSKITSQQTQSQMVSPDLPTDILFDALKKTPATTMHLENSLKNSDELNLKKNSTSNFLFTPLPSKTQMNSPAISKSSAFDPSNKLEPDKPISSSPFQNHTLNLSKNESDFDDDDDALLCDVFPSLFQNHPKSDDVTVSSKAKTTATAKADDMLKKLINGEKIDINLIDTNSWSWNRIFLPQVRLKRCKPALTKRKDQSDSDNAMVIKHKRARALSPSASDSDIFRDYLNTDKSDYDAETQNFDAMNEDDAETQDFDEVNNAKNEHMKTGEQSEGPSKMPSTSRAKVISLVSSESEPEKQARSSDLNRAPEFRNLPDIVKSATRIRSSLSHINASKSVLDGIRKVSQSVIDKYNRSLDKPCPKSKKKNVRLNAEKRIREYVFTSDSEIEAPREITPKSKPDLKHDKFEPARHSATGEKDLGHTGTINQKPDLKSYSIAVEQIRNRPCPKSKKKYFTAERKQTAEKVGNLESVMPTKTSVPHSKAKDSVFVFRSDSEESDIISKKIRKNRSEMQSLISKSLKDRPRPRSKNPAYVMNKQKSKQIFGSNSDYDEETQEIDPWSHPSSSDSMELSDSQILTQVVPSRKDKAMPSKSKVHKSKQILTSDSESDHELKSITSLRSNLTSLISKTNKCANDSAEEALSADDFELPDLDYGLASKTSDKNKLTPKNTTKPNDQSSNDDMVRVETGLSDIPCGKSSDSSFTFGSPARISATNKTKPFATSSFFSSKSKDLRDKMASKTNETPDIVTDTWLSKDINKDPYVDKFTLAQKSNIKDGKTYSKSSSAAKSKHRRSSSTEDKTNSYSRIPSRKYPDKADMKKRTSRPSRGLAKHEQYEKRLKEDEAIGKARKDLLARRKARLAEVCARKKGPEVKRVEPHLDMSQLLEPEEASKYDLAVHGYQENIPCSQLDLDMPNNAAGVFMPPPRPPPKPFTGVTTTSVTSTVDTDVFKQPPSVTHILSDATTGSSTSELEPLMSLSKPVLLETNSNLKPKAPKIDDKRETEKEKKETSGKESAKNEKTSSVTRERSHKSSHRNLARKSRHISGDSKSSVSPDRKERKAENIKEKSKRDEYASKQSKRDEKSSKYSKRDEESAKQSKRDNKSSSRSKHHESSRHSRHDGKSSKENSSTHRSHSSEHSKHKSSSSSRSKDYMHSRSSSKSKSRSLNSKHNGKSVEKSTKQTDDKKATENQTRRIPAADLIPSLLQEKASVVNQKKVSSSTRETTKESSSVSKSYSRPISISSDTDDNKLPSGKSNRDNKLAKEQISKPVAKSIAQDSRTNPALISKTDKPGKTSKDNVKSNISRPITTPFRLNTLNVNDTSHTNYLDLTNYTKHSSKSRVNEREEGELEPDESFGDLSCSFVEKIGKEQKEEDWLKKKIAEKDRLKRAPVKFSDLPPCVVKPKEVLSINQLFQIMLKWNPLWLEEQMKSKNSAPPPVAGNMHQCPLLQSYDAFDDYVRITTVPFLYETWESMFQSYCTKKYRNKEEKIVGYVTTPPVVNQLSVITVQISMKQTPNSSLTEGDIVKLKTKLNNADNNTQRQDSVTSIRFGYVLNSEWVNTRNQNVFVHHLLKPKAGSNERLINLQLRVYLYAPWPIDTPVIIQPVDSLITQVRQYQALIALSQSPLARDILRPCNVRVFLHEPPSTIKKTPANEHLNPSQLAAVSSITHAVLQPYQLPKICMLQGPPGTGKSTVITAIVRRLVSMKTLNNKTPKILLCAPSNAGVDQLIRKFSKNKELLKKLSLVRIGAQERMSDDVKAYSLDEHLWRNKDDVIKKRQQVPSLASAMKNWNNKIGQLKDEIRLAELQGKNSQNKGVNISRQEEDRMRRKILVEAHVICCTLNTAAKSMLLDNLTYETEPLQQANQQGNPQVKRTRTPHFTCVIVDEAAQSLELDTLIPLQYCCSKLVLVGDPRQLPATVKSQRSKDLNYGQSLFERLFEFTQSPTGPNPVQILCTQYRMHQDICHFPNQHVYGGQLDTDKNVAELRRKFFFQPYLVFNVVESQEKSLGTSLYNHEEAVLIMTIAKHLQQSDVEGKNIGVITPYKSQALEIRKKLPHGLDKVSVDTVDGFQGCEKDVIIISTVRTNKQSVGFLSDERRMNVALTRAKYALYVVCNFAALSTDQNWRALLGDAEKRKMTISVRKHADVQRLVKRALHKSSQPKKSQPKQAGKVV